MVKFRAGLRRMRPYRENVPGSVYFAHDSLVGVLHIRDRGTDFYGLFGADRLPSAHLEGGYADIGFQAGRLMEIPGACRFCGKEWGRGLNNRTCDCSAEKSGRWRGRWFMRRPLRKKRLGGFVFPGKRIGTLEKTLRWFWEDEG